VAVQAQVIERHHAEVIVFRSVGVVTAAAVQLFFTDRMMGREQVLGFFVLVTRKADFRVAEVNHVRGGNLMRLVTLIAPDPVCNMRI
jgi:hypothetical protein